jgi:hypothetical protein
MKCHCEERSDVAISSHAKAAMPWRRDCHAKQQIKTPDSVTELLNPYSNDILN